MLFLLRTACTLLYDEHAMQQTTEYRYQFDSLREELVMREPPVSPSPSLTSEDSVSSINSSPRGTNSSSDDEFTPSYHSKYWDLNSPNFMFSLYSNVSLSLYDP